MKLIGILVVLLLSACQTTRYYSSSPDQMTFERMPSGHKFVRTHRASNWEHYFLLNFISARKERDISNGLLLQPGEKCFNVRIQNSIGVGQFFVMAGAFILTYGASPIVWTARNTEVSCDVGVPEAPASQPAAPSSGGA